MNIVQKSPSMNGLAVAFAGPVNIQTIATVHAELIDAINKHGDVIVSLDAAESADLTLVQLLASGRRSAEAAGGSLVLAAPANGDLHDVLRRGGFIETADQRAFWLKSSGEQ